MPVRRTYDSSTERSKFHDGTLPVRFHRIGTVYNAMLSSRLLDTVVVRGRSARVTREKPMFGWSFLRSVGREVSGAKILGIGGIVVN